MQRLLKCLGVLIVALMGPSMAQPATPGVQCPDGRASDGIERAGNAQHCVVIRKFEPATTGSLSKVLVVFVEDDTQGRVVLPPNHLTALNLSQQLKATTIAVLPAANRGEVRNFLTAQDDAHTPRSVRILATALERLRTLNPEKKILLIGHSGGAAGVALIAGRFPSSADAYLLVACPCDQSQRDLSPLPTAGKKDRSTHSLSAQDEVDNIRAGTRIALLIGSRDDVTQAKISEAYAASLQRQGIKTRVTYAFGATHISVLRSPEFFMLARQLSEDLSSTKRLN